jgi:hypothetical protein
MKFESKAHMAQELIAGKRFKNESGSIIHFDDNKEFPFRYGDHPLTLLWGSFASDVWDEVKPSHVHQDLIDAYKAGQAWQYTQLGMIGLYRDCKANGVWVEPDWDECVTYRLHPHNALIQEHRDGAKIKAYICGDWIEEPNPDWYEDTKYRVKPDTNTVYEWMLKSRFNHKWMVEDLLMSEEEAKDYFDEHEYQKTGRSW